MGLVELAESKTGNFCTKRWITSTIVAPTCFIGMASIRGINDIDFFGPSFINCPSWFASIYQLFAAFLSLSIGFLKFQNRFYSLT
jgi:hypothetical protein